MTTRPDTPPAPPAPPDGLDRSRTPLRQLAGVFLRLGATAFGGPAAHMAVMQDEFVRRRRWITHDDFLDMISAANLIPGPNSTEVAIHIGFRRRGLPGLIVAGASFIIPAAVIVAAIGWGYVKYGSLPQIQAILSGVKPVMIAVVLQALWTLRKAAVKNRTLASVALVATALTLVPDIRRLPAWAASVVISDYYELLILFGAGFLMLAIRRARAGQRLHPPAPMFVPLGLAPAAASALPALGTAALPAIFFFFLKVGSVLFGSGYVLLAFLRTGLVERNHWLTQSQLLDAIAVGQVTPGPVFTTATFIGYILTGKAGLIPGLAGAAVATVGIFLPAFFFVAVSSPLIPILRRSKDFSAFLDGLNAASWALMLGVTLDLAGAALFHPGGWKPDGLACFLAAVSAVLLIRFRVNATWLLVGGALVGLLEALRA